MKLKYILFLVLGLFTFGITAQNNNTQIIKLDPKKVQMYEKYLAFKKGSVAGGYDAWKASNPEDFTKEMWYQGQSFFIKKDHLSVGEELPEASIDVSRFEQHRKQNEEAIVILPGFKDALVLLPSNKLLYKPN